MIGHSQTSVVVDCPSKPHLQEWEEGGMRVGEKRSLPTSNLSHNRFDPKQHWEQHSERFDPKDTVLTHMEFLGFTASCAVCMLEEALYLKVRYQEQLLLDEVFWLDSQGERHRCHIQYGGLQGFTINASRQKIMVSILISKSLVTHFP